MADRADALAGLRPDERSRLDRFGRVFDRLDASSYIQLANIVSDEQVGPAQAAARALIGQGTRMSAVRAVIESFIDAATVAYSRRSSLTDTFLMNQSLPDRADDRIRFLESVERVVVGLILWDELDPQHLALLIGPWADLIEGVEGG